MTFAQYEAIRKAIQAGRLPPEAADLPRPWPDDIYRARREGLMVGLAIAAILVGLILLSGHVVLL